MRFSLLTSLTLALAAENAVASTWFGKAAYNKWHETELERWLSDHDVPYPASADRKDLENLVKANWDTKVVSPYHEWDTPQLQHYLSSKGQGAKEGIKGTKDSAKDSVKGTKDSAKDSAKGTKDSVKDSVKGTKDSVKDSVKGTKDSVTDTKDSLINQVKSSWTDTAETASASYASVKDWIFDSWTDSQLKAFLDKHGIPNPNPPHRESMLKAARENYDSVAKKTNEAASYPGNWLYSSWSESDLKEFLDERGIPVPQPTTRDKLVASVRRNSRLASQNAKEASASASASAAGAQKSLTDALFDSWSDSKLKEFADEHGIKVPQGSKRNEVVALLRKHRDTLSPSSVASSASSAYGAATSKVGNQYAQVTDDAQLKGQDAFNAAIGTWSESRLKAFLDARGVPVPQNGKKDELLATVRLHKHKATTGYSAWTFDTWTTENLKKWLAGQNNKAANKAGATRDDLLKQAQDTYATASKSGGSSYASVTSYLASATDAAKDTTFDTWTDSELKSYLDSYGVPNYQGSNSNELRAMARRNANYFRYGTSTPQTSIFGKLSGGVRWVLDLLRIGASSGRNEAAYQGQKGADYVKEAATTATNRAQEAAQAATDKAREEL